MALTGIPAYVSAIDHDAFAVVALGFGGERTVDAAVARAMARNPAYHFVTEVPVHDAYGTSAYASSGVYRGAKPVAIQNPQTDGGTPAAICSNT